MEKVNVHLGFRNGKLEFWGNHKDAPDYGEDFNIINMSLTVQEATSFHNQLIQPNIIYHNYTRKSMTQKIKDVIGVLRGRYAVLKLDSVEGK